MQINWRDKVDGILFGQAVGDALGLGTEFMSKEQLRACYPDGLNSYHQIVQDRHRRRWKQGEWTDDTEQMLCILFSLLELGRVDVCDVARRLRHWAYTNGRGMDRTVRTVLDQPDFVLDPWAAANRVWEEGGRTMAANGGVMRTCVLGIWNWENPDAVQAQASQVCRITHADPRCVQSCELVCLVIAALLRGEEEREALDHSLTHVCSPHPEILRMLNGLESVGLTHLCLDEPESVGYTFKALGAGLWALLHASSFEQGLLAVIHEGGDADTNAAVAGSVLGARFGRSAIPIHWVDGLVDGRQLQDLANHLAIGSSNRGQN